jgi:hypothetical protein
MAINIKTQSFLNKFLEQKLNSFVLNYKKINHLISVHHHLPIDTVSDAFDKKLKIKINSCWSEVLVMETDNIDLSKYSIYSKFQNKLPKPGQAMFIKSNDQRYETTMFDYEFIPFDNINNDWMIPYIRAKINQKIDNLSGLSGTPVFIDDTIIGVFSKFDVRESLAYIIPIYVIIKNLMKKDNTNIYGLPIDLKINKINSYNITDGLIYHPTLKIKVPVNTFMMLEGDVNTKISVRFDMTNIIISHMITKPIKLTISNENYIVNKNLEYKLNPRLLNLIKNFNVNKQIIISLFNHIIKHSDSAMFTIIDNKIKLI